MNIIFAYAGLIALSVLLTAAVVGVSVTLAKPRVYLPKSLAFALDSDIDNSIDRIPYVSPLLASGFGFTEPIQME